jgi:hypothetical protein
MNFRGYPATVASVACLAALTSGCATTRFSEPIDVQDAQIAVMVITPEQSVEFFEIENGILGIITPRTVDNSYAIAGVWDPGEALIQKLRESSTGSPELRFLKDSIDQAQYSSVRQKCEESFNAVRKRQEASLLGQGAALVAEWKSSPPIDYLHKSPPDELLAAARQLGAGYVAEISLGGMVYMASGSKGINKGLLNTIPSTYWVGAYARLIRVSDGAVVRYKALQAGHSVGYIRTFTEIEKDDLAQLKADFGKAVEDLTTKQRLLSQVTR